MPTGWYQFREKEKDYKKDQKYSRQSIEWLEYIMREEEIFIRHAENLVHGEKRIEN